MSFTFSSCEVLYLRHSCKGPKVSTILNLVSARTTSLGCNFFSTHCPAMYLSIILPPDASHMKEQRLNDFHRSKAKQYYIACKLSRSYANTIHCKSLYIHCPARSTLSVSTAHFLAIQRRSSYLHLVNSLVKYSDYI